MAVILPSRALMNLMPTSIEFSERGALTLGSTDLDNIFVTGAAEAGVLTGTLARRPAAQVTATAAEVKRRPLDLFWDRRIERRDQGVRGARKSIWTPVVGNETTLPQRGLPEKP